MFANFPTVLEASQKYSHAEASHTWGLGIVSCLMADTCQVHWSGHNTAGTARFWHLDIHMFWIRCAYYIYMYMPVYVNADIYGHDVLYYSMTITIIYCVYWCVLHTCIFWNICVICKHWNVTLFLSYFFQCPFVNLARLLRFAFFQSLCMIFFRNMRLILRCLRRSIVNSVAANRCSTSGLLSGNAFFFLLTFDWPLH